MVNLTLETRVRYPLYIVIYCKRVHYTADSIVWGSLRLAPITIATMAILAWFKVGYLRNVISIATYLPDIHIATYLISIATYLNVKLYNYIAS